MTPEEQAREIVEDIMADYAMTTNEAAAMAIRISDALAKRDRKIERLKAACGALARAEWAVVDATGIPIGNVEQAIQMLIDQRNALRAQRDALVEALEDIRTYWNGHQNERAMLDACEHAVRVATAALAAGKEEG